jgi:hypothetical protein
MGNLLRKYRYNKNIKNNENALNNKIYMTFEDYIISKIDDIIENDNSRSKEPYQTFRLHEYNYDVIKYNINVFSNDDNDNDNDNDNDIKFSCLGKYNCFKKTKK